MFLNHHLKSDTSYFGIVHQMQDHFSSIKIREMDQCVMHVKLKVFMVKRFCRTRLSTLIPIELRNFGLEPCDL